MFSSSKYNVKVKESGEDISGRSARIDDINVNKGAGATAIVWFKPTAIGNINISASANCTYAAGDAFKRALIVKVGFSKSYIAQYTYK